MIKELDYLKRLLLILTSKDINKGKINVISSNILIIKNELKLRIYPNFSNQIRRHTTSTKIFLLPV